ASEGHCISLKRRLFA
ncbi:glutamate-cysteine ligase family protein, partial [Vibrio parahaemolyticus VPTS-2010]